MLSSFSVFQDDKSEQEPSRHPLSEDAIILSL